MNNSIGKSNHKSRNLSNLHTCIRVHTKTFTFQQCSVAFGVFFPSLFTLLLCGLFKEIKVYVTNCTCIEWLDGWLAGVPHCGFQ